MQNNRHRLNGTCATKRYSQIRRKRYLMHNLVVFPMHSFNFKLNHLGKIKSLGEVAHFDDDVLSTLARQLKKQSF